MKIKLTTIIEKITILILIIIPIKCIFLLNNDEWTKLHPNNPGPIIGIAIPLVLFLGYIIYNWEDWDDYYIDFGVITRFINKIFKL